MCAALANKDAVTVKLINYTFSGTPFHNTLHIQPLKGSDGTITNYCATLSGAPVMNSDAIPLPTGSKRAAVAEASEELWHAPPANRQMCNRLRRSPAHMNLATALNNTEVCPTAACVTSTACRQLG